MKTLKHVLIRFKGETASVETANADGEVVNSGQIHLFSSVFQLFNYSFPAVLSLDEVAGCRIQQGFICIKHN